MTNAATHAGEAMTHDSKTFARYLPTAARVLMGLGFFASGIFGILIVLGVVPIPPSPPADPGTAFFTAMAKTGYFFPLIKVTEAIVGALLLANRFVPLALAVIAPVLVNIVAFHAFLQPAGIVPGAILCALEIYLAWVYRDAFRPMLSARASAGSR